MQVTRFIIFVLIVLLGTAGGSFAQKFQSEDNVEIEVAQLLGHTDTTKPAKLHGTDLLEGFSSGGYSQEHKTKKMLVTTLSIFLTLIVIVIVTMKRRSIAETLSSGWRQNKVCRIWVYFSCVWSVGTLLYTLLVGPYKFFRMDAYELWHVIGIMVIPPFFLGATWFGYKRFVDTEVVKNRPTDPLDRKLKG